MGQVCTKAVRNCSRNEKYPLSAARHHSDRSLMLRGTGRRAAQNPFPQQKLRRKSVDPAERSHDGSSSE